MKGDARFADSFVVGEIVLIRENALQEVSKAARIGLTCC